MFSSKVYVVKAYIWHRWSPVTVCLGVFICFTSGVPRNTNSWLSLHAKNLHILNIHHAPNKFGGFVALSNQLRQVICMHPDTCGPITYAISGIHSPYQQIKRFKTFLPMCREIVICWLRRMCVGWLLLVLKPDETRPLLIWGRVEAKSRFEDDMRFGPQFNLVLMAPTQWHAAPSVGIWIEWTKPIFSIYTHASGSVPWRCDYTQSGPNADIG